MRVVQVTDYGSPHAGSFVPMLEAALALTRDRGWDAHVVLPERARTRSKAWLPAFLERQGDAVHFAPQLGTRGLADWLGDHLGAPEPTILHTHFSAFDLAAALLARRRPDTGVVWHFHTVVGEGLRSHLRNRARFTLASRYVDRMLCVGPGLVEAIEARGAPPAKVRYFPNGVDTARFPGRATQAERRAARAARGIAPDVPVLLHVGREWHLKGADLFVDAFERMDDAHAVGLMLRGGDEAREELRRRGLEHRVQVIDGTEDMRSLHAASDLLMATSRGEGTLPFSVTEALASGLGVVATDIPGHATPAGRPPGMRMAALAPDSIAAEANGLLARAPEEVERDAERSHAWVAEHVSLRAWASRLETLYAEVASLTLGADAAGERPPTPPLP